MSSLKKNLNKMMKHKKLARNIDALCETHGLSREDIQKRFVARERIHKSLYAYYPDCRVLIYGSSLNGYGTKSSDLDLMFLPFPEYNSDSSEKLNEENEIKEIPNMNDVHTGKVPREDLLKMNRNLQLAFVRKILRREKSYQKVMLIRARCPIVRFDIAHFQISCDISCGSSQVIHNTELLHFYNRIDDRVRPLVMILRHWAKSLTFILSGVLSSYGFTLLVIFFLQNTVPPILPSVKRLIELSETSHIVDGWDVAFTTDKSKVEKTYNKKCCGELLKEFLSFYWNFDFSSYVVSIYYGEGLQIKQLLESNDERLKSFEVSPVCIQDPFILSCNVGRNMNHKLFTSFKHALFLAMKIIDRIENDLLSDNFDLLFDAKEYTKLTHQFFDPSLPDKAKFCHIYFNPESIISFDCNGSLKQTWHQTVCQALLDLLQYGLLIDCEVIDKAVFNNSKVAKQCTDEKNFELLMSIQCAVFNRTYVGRAKIKEVPSVDCDSEQFNNSILRHEYIISNYLIQQNSLLTCHEPFFWFYCDCYKSTFDQLNGIVVALTPLTEFKDSKSMFYFLTSFILKNFPKMVLGKSNLTSRSPV